MILEVKVETGYLPERQHAGDAGFDLRSAQEAIIYPGNMMRIKCGISIAVPQGFVADVRSRSGLANRAQVAVLNAPGTIDSGYRGELSVMLINHGENAFEVKRGDRIAQLVLLRIPEVELLPVAELSPSHDGRGEGGHGSTGT